MKIFFRVLMVCTLISIVSNIMLECNTEAAKKKTRGPRLGDTVCWYNSVEKKSCGTMAWSNVPSYAKTLAKNKCISYCETECKLVYCEKLERKNFVKNEKNEENIERRE